MIESSTQPRHLLDGLLYHATHRPKAVAIVDQHDASKTWTWLRLASAVDVASQALRSLFVDPACDHRRLAYRCHNQPRDVILSLACVAAGITEIPIDAFLPTKQQNKLFTRCDQAGAIRLDREWSPATDRDVNGLVRLQQSADAVDVDQASLVLWTSGTTSEPRGVMLSQANLTTNAIAKLRAVPQTKDDLRLSLLSIAHAYARTSDMGTWLLSGCQLCLGRGRKTLAELSPDISPTLINAVPILIDDLLHRIESGQPNLPSLRLIGCGGVAMSSQQFDRCQRNGIDIIQGYGCTEASPVICSASPGLAQPGRVGPPVNGWQIRVEQERLFVRGPGVMLGYLDDPAATSQKIDVDGWLDTGDWVRTHDDGQFQILGRADDVIVLPSGFKVHPQSIEQAVLAIEGVEQAVLIATNNELCLLVHAPTTGTQAIAAFVQERLPTGTDCRVVLLAQPLSVETGELTSKGTPRRQTIRQRLISS